ncbi:MAG: BMP family ABC transporter substrate-binding protein [Clostridiales bacterium]|nr:BMP family ABC transporter substrate-binding protein [Clostridiales bacterium]
MQGAYFRFLLEETPAVYYNIYCKNCALLCFLQEYDSEVRKMRKMIALLLALVMIACVFAGCKGGEAGPDGEGTKLALVVAGKFGDRSFYDSSKEGAGRLAADLGVEVTYIECNNENHDTQMKNAADGADIVVCVGWEFYDIETIAPEYPDVKWIWIDNATSAPVANILNITYAQNEGSFLAGYAAAAISESGVVGAVGGEDCDTINDFIVGYEQGAKYYSDSIQVVHNYTNSYDDPAAGKDCAIALNDEGADVVFQIASAAGDGVFEAAQEKGFLAIGVDSDQKYINPDVIACSMKKEVGNSIYDAVKAFEEGDLSLLGTTWVADMGNGYVGLGYGDDGAVQQISDEIKAEIEALAAKIVSGEIVVDTTR